MTLVHFNLSMALQFLKDVLRYVIIIVGEQSVMIPGATLLLE